MYIPHIGEVTKKIDTLYIKIDTHFARDGGIAPVDVLFRTGAVIRRWHANRKWLLCDFLISCGVGLFVVLRCGRSTMPSFDYSCHAIRVLVVRCVSKSGGLVHSRNRYRALKLVFVLWHIGSSRSPVNTACHTVAYGEKPRTDRTCCLSIRLPSSIA